MVVKGIHIVHSVHRVVDSRAHAGWTFAVDRHGAHVPLHNAGCICGPLAIAHSGNALLVFWIPRAPVTHVRRVAGHGGGCSRVVHESSRFRHYLCLLHVLQRRINTAHISIKRAAASREVFTRVVGSWTGVHQPPTNVSAHLGSTGSPIARAMSETTSNERLTCEQQQQGDV